MQIAPISALLSSSFLASSAWANTPGDGLSSGTGLEPLDWGIIALYALTTIGLGVYFSRGQRSANEYFTGSGNMNPALIGVSIFATLLSTISYLSYPGETIGKGPMHLASLLALPFVFLIVGYGLLPVYMKHRVTSAYELLEARLGLSVRLLGTCMFLALRLVWMTLLVYLAAKAMVVMMGVDPKHIPWVVLATGLVSVIYTTLGGLRAVVVTDLLQTVLLFGGALLVIVTVSWLMGGFGWFPTQRDAHWDIQPIISADPKTRITLVGTVLSVLCWHVCTAGGDQTAVQRFMATRDVHAARKALLIHLCVAATVMITLTLVGLALLGYLRSGGFDMTAEANPKKIADDLFPRYISHHLPVGISGLVVSAMFAAAMSSIDSGVNSVTAVIMTDFLDRFGYRPKTKKGHMWVARILALGIGTVVVLGSSYAGYIPGNISAQTQKTVALLTTPIFTLFIFALFMPRVGTLGAWLGTAAGVAVAATIAFSGPLVYFLHTKFGVDLATFNVEIIEKLNPATNVLFETCEDPVSFQYIGPASLVVGVGVGAVVGLVRPQRDRSIMVKTNAGED